MPPKEPSRAQLSSRLQFQSKTPNFLRAFQSKVSGRYQDEDEPSYDNLDEYQLEGEQDEFGRERPALDEFGREIRRGGSAEVEKRGKRREEEEELDEERPLVVVLKEGKHLTEREAENERRKAKGLPPLPDEDEPTPDTTADSSKPSASTSTTAKSTKSGVQMGSRSANKRKAPIGGREDDGDDLADTIRKKKEQKKDGGGGPPKKKVKKEKKGAQKGLLSFGDDG